MKQKLLHILALVVVMLVSSQAYAQKTQQTLTLGDYDNPSDMYQGDKNGAPIFYEYTNCGTQTLYTADELVSMKNSDITSITFKSNISDCYIQDYSSSLKVYLQEVDSPEFVKNASGKYEWYSVTTPIYEVDYSADFMMESTEYGYGDFEVKIDLSAKPYHYTGKNLIVTVVNNNSNQTVQNIFFYCQPVDSKIRTLSFASDKIDFDTNQKNDNIVNPLGNEQLTKQAPVAKFTYQETSTPEPPAPGPHELSIGDYYNTNLKFDGFNDDITPIVFNYCHSGSQTIYTAEELKEMKGKDITKIAFRMYNEFLSDYTFNSKLYIQEISDSKFNFNTTEQAYEWFDYNKSIKAESHQTVTLDTYCSDDELIFNLSEFPFSYDGNALLLTIINDVETCLDTSNGYISFYYYEPATRQSYKYGSDNDDFLTYITTNKYMNGGNDPEATPVVKFTYDDKFYTGAKDAVAAQKHSVTTTAGAVVLNLSENDLVEIFDISGKVVVAKNFMEGYNTVDMQNGIYIVKIGNEVHKVCVIN